MSREFIFAAVINAGEREQQNEFAAGDFYWGRALSESNVS